MQDMNKTNTVKTVLYEETVYSVFGQSVSKAGIIIGTKTDQKTGCRLNITSTSKVHVFACQESM